MKRQKKKEKMTRLKIEKEKNVKAKIENLKIKNNNGQPQILHDSWRKIACKSLGNFIKYAPRYP